MSKKHFQTVASCIAAARREQNAAPTEPYGLTIAENLADAFALENPRFDRARFLVACDFDRAALEGWGSLEVSS